MKTFSTSIPEVGSSSSDDTKRNINRVSTVQEQKTEEDAEDSQAAQAQINKKWNNINDKEGESE
jgi:hypothetical protein